MAPNRKAGATSLLKHTVGLCDLKLIVWHNHKTKICEVGIKVFSGEGKSLIVNPAAINLSHSVNSRLVPLKIAVCYVICFGINVHLAIGKAVKFTKLVALFHFLNHFTREVAANQQGTLLKEALGDDL